MIGLELGDRVKSGLRYRTTRIMQPIGQLNFSLINKFLWYGSDKDNGLVIWLYVKIHFNIYGKKYQFIPLWSWVRAYVTVSITLHLEPTIMIS